MTLRSLQLSEFIRNVFPFIRDAITFLNFFQKTIFMKLVAYPIHCIFFILLGAYFGKYLIG